MKFTAAVVLAAAAGASAHYNAANVTVVTEIVDVYTTFCPAATEITHGTKTYTVTEATTLTITDCPCTVTRAVTTSSVVACNTCAAFTNSTAFAVGPTAVPSTGAVVIPTTGGAVPTAPTVVPSSGASKAAMLSGAGLAGLVGLAFLL